MILQYRILAEGNVQGVNYRSLAKRIADELGVKGFARNLPDGRVEIVCECGEEKLGEFKNRLERKSSSFFGMNVEKITVEKLSFPQKFSSFEIEF
ncbi:MAG: acylphosphatase [Candidatus Micrarchaeota archaeon]